MGKNWKQCSAPQCKKKAQVAFTEDPYDDHNGVPLNKSTGQHLRYCWEDAVLFLIHRQTKIVYQSKINLEAYP